MVITTINELFVSLPMRNRHQMKICSDIVNTELVNTELVKTFDPQINLEQIGSMSIITFSLAVVALYWWNVVIPTKRKEVALSKSRGEIRDYLDDIRENNDKSFERWFLTDWLNQTKNKPAAIPFLKKAKWNSGDNPILVAFAGIFSLILIAGFAERGSEIR
jgi:hypothetical protein